MQVTPYNDETANIIYNLLFCDDFQLYKDCTEPPYTYPMDVLFAETPDIDALQQLVALPEADPRVQVLACNRLLAAGQPYEQKQLFAVIIEIGLENGLDTLASFYDGTARYINQTGKILVWENFEDETANDITSALFEHSAEVVNKIGPWDQPRKPQPAVGHARLTFLVSDGLYFGEAPASVFFNDQLAGPVLNSATQLLQYITAKALEEEESKQ
ncbi:hypothetical protein SAMN05421788_10889 [Filimonas lacunae]|uniref:Uncharacterized protein n=1 Tax=Filimonas lacunae TaxID=477680 RepID=A0A173MEA5_9BACT|nr:hypothetical protein [Filimonas lacunae]BAV05768.1 hypothetical protein FLA_1780 [Filimonas lacunae]SIT28677.1 hypothetical protein SAMN05421788_10889 [Filimonas lacunae]